MGAKLDTGVGAKRGRPEINAEPNVIPFIDVMLVMLIIFMVTAPIAAVDVRAKMPESQVVASKRPNKPVWVTIADGPDCFQKVHGKEPRACPAYFVMEEEVEPYQIASKTLDALKVASPEYAHDLDKLREQRVYLRASGSTPYNNVVRVMNNLQDSYLTKVALVASDKHR